MAKPRYCWIKGSLPYDSSMCEFIEKVWEGHDGDVHSPLYRIKVIYPCGTGLVEGQIVEIEPRNLVWGIGG